MPKLMTVHTSKAELLSVYAPIRVIVITRGPNNRKGILSNCTHRPTRGIFKITKKTFPTYIDAISPQKTSGCSVINRGPGSIPCIRNAPNNKAMTTLGGIPRVRRGINAELAAALLADSGAATPSIAPFPNFSGCLDNRFSKVYESIEDITTPAPGIMPRTKPIIVPRRTAHLACAQSAAFSHTLSILLVAS